MEAGDRSEGAGGASGSQTLLRGLDVIDAVLSGALPLAELSERLGLTRSTTHRLASALVDRRLLSYRPREGYGLGPKLIALGHAAGLQMPLPRVARPWMEQLSLETRDTIHLGVMDGRHALYLDKIDGQRRVSIGSRLGERQPLTSTALGKALLLDLAEPRLREIHFANPKTSPDALEGWLGRMKTYAAGGYALDLEENEDQVRCVAAPIRAVDGKILAAISVSPAAQYMDDARMMALAPLVIRTAQTISADLGWAAGPKE